jgi:hypothetical protein
MQTPGASAKHGSGAHCPWDIAPEKNPRTEMHCPWLRFFVRSIWQLENRCYWEDSCSEPINPALIVAIGK